MKKVKRKFKHLNESERFVIEKLLVKRASIRGIALVLDRSPNTISREVERNSVYGKYSADKAKHKAWVKRKYSKHQCMKVAMDSFLARFVEEKLELKWSPKQMSGYLKDLGIRVSAKAIYKFICSRGLEYRLFWGWNKRKSGRKKYRYDQSRDDRKYIDVRPKILEHGHYEMDFIVSKHSTWVLLVVVEMKTRFAQVIRLPNRKRSTILGALSRLFRGVKVESLTTDNDIAFLCWKDIEALLHTQVYFTHPYHSWEKGLVENTNRWIRCFVAKKRDIGTVTQEEIYQIHSFLNDRPRAVTGFRFPSELYYKLTSVLIEG
jgi:IS30 family transposase